MSNKRPRLLIVDDEPVALKNLEHVLEKEGYDITACDTGAQAIEHLEQSAFDVVLTDLKMKQVDGMQVLEHSKTVAADSEVIVVTGYATPETAVQAMQNGAFYYIAKPYRLEEVRKVVKEAVEKVRLKKQNRALKAQIETYRGKVRIITQHSTMQNILDTAHQVAGTDCNILLTGESGTGKELLARYIHNNSNRSSGPFIAVNCGAFTADLLSNELFGHEKDAFTGATRMKKGLLETVSGGTLLLDEITEMPLSMQVKLLRVIQEQELIRIGGTSSIPIDVRFFATTNRNPDTLVSSGRLRNDLYYRLNVVSFHLPPLRDRDSDVLPLAQYFIDKYAVLMEKNVKGLSEDASTRLSRYSFPGNIRELENIIERGIALARGTFIEAQDLPDHVNGPDAPGFRKTGDHYPSLQEHEAAYIEFILDKTGGNKTEAAEILGIDRVSLWRKLKKPDSGN